MWFIFLHKMIDLLPEDLLYYIAEKINDVSTVNKFRLLSTETYCLIEKVKFNNIIISVGYQNYKIPYYEKFNTIKRSPRFR